MEQLTKRERETYDLFTNYKKQNPNATNQEAFKATKTNTHTLHVAKKKLGLVKSKSAQKPAQAQAQPKSQITKRKYTKPVMQTIAVQEPVSRNFAVIICNQSNIMDVINAIG